MSVYITNSPEETEELGLKLAKSLKGGEVVAFRGGLGMGKTCFTRGLARGLGFKGDVTSPTFALINEYIGGRLPLYHFDMYRIHSLDELYSTGFFDYLDCGGIMAIEWSENIAAVLEQERCIAVSIEPDDENIRIITVNGGDRF